MRIPPSIRNVVRNAVSDVVHPAAEGGAQKASTLLDSSPTLAEGKEILRSATNLGRASFNRLLRNSLGDANLGRMAGEQLGSLLKRYVQPGGVPGLGQGRPQAGPGFSPQISQQFRQQFSQQFSQHFAPQGRVQGQPQGSQGKPQPKAGYAPRYTPQGAPKAAPQTPLRPGHESFFDGRSYPDFGGDATETRANGAGRRSREEFEAHLNRGLPQAQRADTAEATATRADKPL